MKKLFLLVSVLLIVGVFACTTFAQSVTNSQQVQLSQYWREHRNELKIEKNSVLQSPGEIPPKLQQTFKNNDLYKGWESAPVYLDKNTSLYNLYLKRDSTITVYGFDDGGKAVTYNSYTVHQE